MIHSIDCNVVGTPSKQYLKFGNMWDFLPQFVLLGLFCTSGNCNTSEAAKVCFKPMDAGPCEASITKYFYNQSSGRCEEFSYGGCYGNDNNFGTPQECQRNCVNVCFLPMNAGPCEASIKRYFYNATSGRCENFRYGGCFGNDNNFRTLPQCQRKCVNVCQLHKRVGPCEAAEPTYFFDAATGKCELFLFGGCDPNANNFKELEECKRRCPYINKVCLEPQDLGKVVKYTVRWTFDMMRWECVPFVYGGAEGNDNNFQTYQECRGHCPINDVCRLPPDEGPGCHEPVVRWHYDTVSKKCREFKYGGCLGNDNKFETKLACQMRCPKQSICAMPKKGEADPEAATFLERYYYDMEQEACLYFRFSGIKGNENNFNSLNQCLLSCPVMSKCAQPMDAGEGISRQLQIYYNLKTMKCEYFIYNGGGGNDNRFSTKGACMNECSRGERDICTMKKEEGPCHGFLTRWYYDENSRRCSSFIYGGCKGNSNNFKTNEECVERCQ